MTHAFDWIDEPLSAAREAHLERSLRTRATPDLLDFCSNDYLGLARDPRVIAAACAATTTHGYGATASPAVSGWHAPHAALARALAEFEGTEAALLFPSGYAALSGTIVALIGRGDAIYLDRLAHASIVAGARQSGASLRVFPHNDATRLDEMLARDRGRFRRVMIATEGVFSMDGDAAPLEKLCELAERHDSMVLVDEAHATGVLGPGGRGAAAEFGVSERLELRLGTLSKALGSQGGFAVGSRRVIQHLVNLAPSFLFSTALPPSAAAAALASVQILQEESHRTEAVRARADSLAEALRSRGWSIPPIVAAILPVMIGDPERALAISERVRAHGVLVPAIRPPTVPRNSSRLRVTVSYAHTDEQVAALVRALGSP